MDVKAARARLPPPFEDGLVQRMDPGDVEVTRVDEGDLLDAFLRLSTGLGRRVERRGGEVREHVAPRIVLTLPQHRADELSDVDRDPCLLVHLPRRRLLERLARLVVPRRKLPVDTVRTPLANQKHRVLVHDDAARAGQRRPGHTVSHSAHACS